MVRVLLVKVTLVGMLLVKVTLVRVLLVGMLLVKVTLVGMVRMVQAGIPRKPRVRMMPRKRWRRCSTSSWR